jgi:ABC-2 type transport system permease protein
MSEPRRANALADWRQTLHAEWTKTRTLPGTGWTLLGLAAATYAVSAAATFNANCPNAACDQDPAKIALAGLYAGQAIAAVLAVGLISAEYRTQMIKVTLTAMPRRIGVLTAKALLAAGLTALAGTVAVIGCLLGARLALPGRGFSAANGYASVLDGAVLRAGAGSVLYLVLVALLALGIATAIRDSAAATGSVLGLLYLSPVIATVVSNPVWHNRLERYLPMNAGLAVQATRGSQPIGPWAGLGVLAAWSAAALLAAGIAIRLRDA